MKKNIQKIISVFLISGIFAPSFSYAVIPVADGPNTAQSVMNIIKEYGLDTMVPILTQTLASKLANKVFNKANGGASGDSSQRSFITNFSDYFGSLTNQQIDKFVTDIGLSKNPFAEDISKGVIRSAQNLNNRQDPLSAFNLDRVVGANWKNFSNDASIGGWDGILALSNPVNTNIGSKLLAQENLARAIDEANRLETLKLTTPGTRPQGTCTLDFNRYKAQVQKIKDSRSDLRFVQEALNSGEDLYNDDGSDMSLDDLGNFVKDNRSSIAANSLNLAEEYGGCLQEFINNPVSLVTSGIDASLRAVNERLTAGDEIGELVGGVLTTMISTFIRSGITALQADFRPSRQTVGGPEQLLGSNGQNIPWTQTPYTIVDLQQDLPSAIATTEQEVNDLKEYIALVTKADETDNTTYASAVTNLDQCIPGPDYGYNRRLAAYLSKQTKRLEKRKEKGTIAKQTNKGNALENIDASIDSARIYTDLFMSDSRYNIPGAGIMSAQVATIQTIADRYQDARSELIKKQITLNILYSLESRLQSQLQGELLNQYLPGIPERVTFTERAWSESTDIQKNQLVTWAKSMNKFPATLPFNEAEWNALSATQKTSLVTWATDTLGRQKPTTTTDVNFVLGAVYAMLDTINPGSPVDDIKRDFVLATTWNVWMTPQQYMNDPWNPNNSPDAVKFLDEKNKVRAEYQSIQNDVSLPFTAQRARGNLMQLETIISDTRNLKDDCLTLRELVLNENTIDRNSNDAHRLLKSYLLQNKDKFKSKLFIDSLENESNILSQNPIANTNTFEMVYRNQFFKCDSLGDNCYLEGIELLHPAYGYDEREDLIPIDVQNNLNKLQSQPAKNIWELLAKKDDSTDTAFCGFNDFVKVYMDNDLMFTLFGTNYYTPNTKLDGGKPIECSNEWIKIGPTEFRNIIYGSDDFENLSSFPL